MGVRSPATTYVSTWPLLVPMTTAEHVSPYLHKYGFNYGCYCCCCCWCCTQCGVIDVYKLLAACATCEVEDCRLRCKPSQGVEMGCEQPTDCCVGTDTECRCSSCCAWCQLNTACHVYAAELFTLWPVYWLPDLHLQADCRSPAHHYKKLLLLVLQQVSERVKQVLCKAATDLTKHGPDNAIVEHAPYATEQVAV